MSEAYPTPVPQKNGFGVTALVTGLVGILLAWIPVVGFLGFILAALAIVFGAVGFYRARKGAASHGLAVAGLALGVVAFIVSTVVWVTFANQVSNSLNQPHGPVFSPANVPGQPTNAGDHVTFEAIGTGTLHVNYMLGGSMNTADVQGPWSKEGDVPKNDYSKPTLSVTRFDSTGSDNGQIGCRIKVNGKVVREQYATGDMASADCTMY